LAEVTKEFSLAGLNARAAIFSYEKLNWYNNYYIQRLKEEEFKEKA
jgi:glutamyl/glutaminyl-tRNA synthetase